MVCIMAGMHEVKVWKIQHESALKRGPVLRICASKKNLNKKGRSLYINLQRCLFTDPRHHTYQIM